MIDIAVLKQRLAEAEQAYHRLSIGKSAVTLQENDRKITFTAAKMADLRAYIDDLKRQIADIECPIPPRRGPFVISY
jgi:hypothetical protein